MKKEALKLADELEKPVPVPNQPDMIYIDGHRMYGAQMLRRLVEELDKQKETIRKLNKTLGFINSGYEVINLEPQTKPLSDEELYEVFNKCYPNNGDGDVVTLIDFARAIEERHGIK